MNENEEYRLKLVKTHVRLDLTLIKCLRKIYRERRHLFVLTNRDGQIVETVAEQYLIERFFAVTEESR